MQRWDEELAAFAKAYAQKCVWGHNKERGRRGENLFAITDEVMDVPLAMEEWYQEHAYYNLSAATCAQGQVCGHYTQVRPLEMMRNSGNRMRWAVLSLATPLSPGRLQPVGILSSCSGLPPHPLLYPGLGYSRLLNLPKAFFLPLGLVLLVSWYWGCPNRVSPNQPPWVPLPLGSRLAYVAPSQPNFVCPSSKHRFSSVWFLGHFLWYSFPARDWLST